MAREGRQRSGAAAACSFPNVTLHDGDATLLLPKVLRHLRGSRVVLFTDGPKGYAGQWLQRLANALPHVVFNLCTTRGQAPTCARTWRIWSPG